MKLRPATAADRPLLDRATAALARRDASIGSDPRLTPFVLVARSGRRGVVWVSINRWSLGGVSPALWVAGGYAPAGATAAERTTAARLLVALARAAGCKSVEFSTTRPGWSRRARQLGFAPSATVYAQETR